MAALDPITPGEILLEEFLGPLSISQNRLARALHVPVSRISDIVKGRRRITGEMALLLSKAFGTTPQFWMNLQSRYDLKLAETAMATKEDVEPLVAVA